MNIFKCLQYRYGESCFRTPQNPNHEPSFVHDISSNVSILKRFAIEEKLNAHHDTVNSISFDETGNRIASGCNNGKVNIWDLSKANSLKLLKTFDFGSTSMIYTTNFMPKSNSDIVLSGGDDRMISISSLSHGSCFKKFNCHRSSIWKVEVEKNNPNIFLSASEDSTVRFFDLREKHRCGSFDSRCHNILVDLRKEDKRLYNGNGISITTFSTFHIEIYSLVLNPMNSNYFVIGGNDPIVRLFDRRMLSTSSTNPNKAKPVHQWIPIDISSQSQRNSNTHFVTGLSWSHDGNKIAASYSGNQIFILDSRLSKFEDLSKKSKKKKRKSSFNEEDEETCLSRSKIVKQEEIESDHHHNNEEIAQQNNNNDFTLQPSNMGIRNPPNENSIRGYGYSRRLRLTVSHGNTETSQRQIRFSDQSPLNFSPENIRPLIYSNIYSSPIQLRRYTNNTDNENTTTLNNNQARERNRILHHEENNRDQNRISIGRWLRDSIQRGEFQNHDLEVISICKGHKNIESECKNVSFWGAESQYVISGSDDGTIFIWDIRKKEAKIVNILPSVDNNNKSVSCVIIHPQFLKIISSGNYGEICVWSPILSKPKEKDEKVIEEIVKKNEDDIKQHMEIRSRLPRVMVNIIQLIWPTTQ